MTSGEQTSAPAQSADPTPGATQPPAAAPAAAATPADTPSGEPAAKPAAAPATDDPTAKPAAAPESYTLKNPDGSLLADDDVAFIGEEAKAMGLNAEQAQKLLDVRASAVKQVADSLLVEAKADPEIGGAKWDATVKDATEGMAYLFKQPDELQLVQGFFERTGLGNHKVFLRAMARLGRERREDAPPRGNGSDGPKERKPTEAVLFGG